jgi:O-antigen/teichoic acid export membrane protein
MASLQHPRESAAGAGTPPGQLWRNAGWLLAERGVRFVLVFVTSVLVTRHLGPTEAGVLWQALALAIILGGFCDLGLDSIVRLQVIRTPGQRGAILGTALALRLGMVPPVFALLAWLLIQDPAGRAGPGLILGVGLTLAMPAVLIIDSWFQARTQARYSVWGQTAALGAGALLRVGGIAAGAAVGWFGLAAGLEVVLAGLALALLYRRTDPAAPRWHFQAATARRLLASSWSLALTNLAILLYTRIDVVMLSRLRDAHEAGLYAAAVRLTEVGYILPMIVVNTLFPTLARLHATDPEGFGRTFRQLTAAIAWAGVATAAVLGLGARGWIHLLYGADFGPAAPVLAVGAATCIFAGLGAIRAQWLLLHGLQHYGFYFVGLGAALNLVLNAWLIPRSGALGAAVASLATQAFIVLVAPLFFAPVRRSVGLLLGAFVLAGIRRPPASSRT